jgi:biopolymer transport protein ExbB/TolQ
MIIVIEWLARLVLLLLVGLSIWSVSIMIERRRFFSTLSNLRPLGDRLRLGQFADFTRELASGHARAATIFSEISQMQDPEKVERSFGAFLLYEKEQLEKGLSVLGTLGATAPFIGLLGTVMGIIVSFGKLSQGGGGGTDAVMLSLAEALILTAVGLVVAIPAVVAFNYFGRRTKATLNELTVLKDLYLAYRK